MKRIHKVAVLGAGTMGARIAAHFANAGVPSYCSISFPRTPTALPATRSPPPDSRLRRNPSPPLSSKPALARLVTVGNFEDDLKRLSEVDWIIEAVVENLEIKRALLKKVEAIRKPGTIITTNTSGLPVAKIAEGFSEDFRQVAGSARIFSIRRATCGCWRLFPRRRPTAPRSTPSRTSATCISAKASCSPRTRRTSSPIASARFPCST